MRIVRAEEIEEAVRRLAIEVNYFADAGLRESLRKALKREESELGREILEQLLENMEVAASEKIPLCQDTGVVIVSLEIGREVSVKGDLYKAINRGVARGYREGYLRGSIVGNPLFERRNTGDNTPAIIHVDLIGGDRLRLTLMAKGAGAENMSRLTVLKPSEGLEDVENFVLKTVAEAEANACPPLIIGIGIGGTFDSVGWLAKKALLRGMGVRNTDPRYAELELRLLDKVNKLGIGPMGVGGRVTALDLRIEAAPSHIASLPVAVNLDCHAHRVRRIEL